MTAKVATSVFYPKAPIAEAVIAFDLTNPLDEKVQKKLSKLDGTAYAFCDKELLPNFKLNLETEKLTVDKMPNGIRLSSRDRADICLYRTLNFACSRLAPYTGWDDLSARTRADWSRLQKLCPRTKVSRVGVRFINRIDVPRNGKQAAKVEDYLKVWPRLPNLGDSVRIAGYIMQIHRPAPEECKLIINSTPLPNSPVPNSDSFVLDLDLYRDTNIPEAEVDLWKLLDRMRRVKNSFFESFITAKARKLFQ